MKIKGTFLKLLKEKKANQITVTEICRETPAELCAILEKSFVRIMSEEDLALEQERNRVWNA